MSFIVRCSFWFGLSWIKLSARSPELNKNKVWAFFSAIFCLFIRGVQISGLSGMLPLTFLAIPTEEAHLLSLFFLRNRQAKKLADRPLGTPSPAFTPMCVEGLPMYLVKSPSQD